MKLVKQEDYTEHLKRFIDIVIETAANAAISEFTNSHVNDISGLIKDLQENYSWFARNV